MTTISLKLPDHLLRALEQEAARRGVPKSVVIRDSLENTLRKPRKANDQPSCLDLMGDIAGSLHGPTDLSTNKKYLREAISADYERQQRKARG